MARRGQTKGAMDTDASFVSNSKLGPTRYSLESLETKTIPQSNRHYLTVLLGLVWPCVGRIPVPVGLLPVLLSVSRMLAGLAVDLESWFDRENYG